MKPYDVDGDDDDDDDGDGEWIKACCTRWLGGIYFIVIHSAPPIVIIAIRHDLLESRSLIGSVLCWGSSGCWRADQQQR